MKNSILSYNEMDNMLRNLSMIENRLGYSVPRDIVNVSELKGKILNEVELNNVVCNIRMISNRRSNSGDTVTLLASTLPWSLPLIVCLVTLLTR